VTEFPSSREPWVNTVIRALYEWPTARPEHEPRGSLNAAYRKVTLGRGPEVRLGEVWKSKSLGRLTAVTRRPKRQFACDHVLSGWPWCR